MALIDTFCPQKSGFIIVNNIKILCYYISNLKHPVKAPFLITLVYYRFYNYSLLYTI